MNIIIPKQNDTRLLPAIRNEGCLLLVYLRVSSLVCWNQWTPWQINTIYQAYTLRNWIKKDCTVLQPDFILKELGVPLGHYTRHEPSEYQPKKQEIQILEYFNPGTGHTHFILGAPYQWDPLGNSRTVREGHVVRKIIVTLHSSVKALGVAA